GVDQRGRFQESRRRILRITERLMDTCLGEEDLPFQFAPIERQSFANPSQSLWKPPLLPPENRLDPRQPRPVQQSRITRFPRLPELPGADDRRLGARQVVADPAAVAHV